ncbi:MAG: T9SS type A sorting domain-containing protein, partial [Ginsengibacter sp.]
ISAQGQKVYVSGNPFVNMINLRFASQPKNKVTLRLLDLAGKSIIFREFKNPGHSLEFNASSKYISKGVYLLEAIVDGAKFVYNVVKD